MARESGGGRAGRGAALTKSHAQNCMACYRKASKSFPFPKSQLLPGGNPNRRLHPLHFFNSTETAIFCVLLHRYGFIIMDGNGSLFGTLCGNTRDVLHKFTVRMHMVLFPSQCSVFGQYYHLNSCCKSHTATIFLSHYVVAALHRAERWPVSSERACAYGKAWVPAHTWHAKLSLC